MAIEVSVMGFDIAKNVFQVHGVDRRGAVVLRRRLRRAQVPEFFRQLMPCVIGMEATRGAHYWA
jgi:transposase